MNQLIKRGGLAVLLSLAIANTAFAINPDFPQFGSYYTIDDSPTRSSLASSKTLQIPVSNWVRHPGDPPQTSKEYNRVQDFGKWIDDPSDDTCYNTRAKVLVRDSVGNTSVSDANECLINEGRWKDPYTGATLTLAADVQVDHMVPLKNAYISGAWKWSGAKRCAYANFMGNDFHLLSVDATENMSKSDKSPEGYLPSNKRYICTYLLNWLKVKTIWSLTMTPPEVKAIKDAMSDYKCEASKFVMTKPELDRQRNKIRDYQSLCQRALNDSVN